jgi:hypothetical protein
MHSSWIIGARNMNASKGDLYNFIKAIKLNFNKTNNR